MPYDMFGGQLPRKFCNELRRQQVQTQYTPPEPKWKVILDRSEGLLLCTITK